MKIKLTHPLISCICITANRPQLLLRSVICFDAQDYPNKELVISYPEEDAVTKNIVREIIKLSGLNILLVERNQTTPLGVAQHEAIVKCNGEYICIWDDDDWYHYRRIKFQYNSLKVNGKYYEASILNRLMIYDTTKETAYISAFNKWNSTLLCKKSIILQYSYEEHQFIQDKEIIESLESRKLLLQLTNSQYLYLFIYHGDNRLNYSSLLNMVSESTTLDEESLEWIKSIVATNIQLINSSNDTQE